MIIADDQHHVGIGGAQPGAQVVQLRLALGVAFALYLDNALIDEFIAGAQLGQFGKRIGAVAVGKLGLRPVELGAYFPLLGRQIQQRPVRGSDAQYYLSHMSSAYLIAK